MSLADKALDSFVDFVLSQPGLEAMAAFRWPDEFSDELGELLEKNNAGTISKEEMEELQMISTLNHLGRMLSAKAKLKLKQRDELE
jgi:hypothetical protein